VADARKFSTQTVGVLAALCADPLRWRHGYDLAKETGLKSGTLYPILVRLTDRELVEARWETEQPIGRPRRHLYRLTAGGLAQAQAASAASAAATVTARARRPRGVPHRLGLAREGAP
jgi:PadR family transcriptional regulator, regulatory protein PadR